MKTKKMITMGVLAMVVWLELLFQPQPALAANGEAEVETEAGMPDTSGRQKGDSSDAGDMMGTADGDNAAVGNLLQRHTAKRHHPLSLSLRQSRSILA